MKCKTCKGRGVLIFPVRLTGGQIVNQSQRCMGCAGTGKIGGKPLPKKVNPADFQLSAIAETK